MEPTTSGKRPAGLVETRAVLDKPLAVGPSPRHLVTLLSMKKLSAEWRSGNIEVDDTGSACVGRTNAGNRRGKMPPFCQGFWKFFLDAVSSHYQADPQAGPPIAG